MAWSSPPFLSAGAVLVGAHDCGVEHHELVVGISGQNLEKPCEYTTFTPSPLSPMRGFPMSVALGRIAPGNACSIAIDDGIDEHTIVGGCTPDMALATGQKVPDPVPLVAAKSVTMHVSASHCRRPMSQRQTDLGVPEMTISQPKTRVLAPNVAKETQLN